MKKTLALLFLFNITISISQAQSIKYQGDTIGIWHVINFDTTFNYIQLDTSTPNIWQVGVPQKNYFNTAYSASKAIVTDTVNYYPVSNHSYFDLYVGNFNYNGFYPYDIFIDFRHKYDTDTLKDGGYITVSWDKGLTWMNVIKDSVYNWGISPGTNWFNESVNLYSISDTLYNGEYGFSGNSNGWVHTSMTWHLIPVKDNFPPDTMIVRFNFISDAINQPREGWMIDNIRLFSVDLGGGVHEILNSNNCATVAPNPFTSNTEISFNKNYDLIQLEVYDMQGKLIAVKEYNDSNKILFNRDGIGNGLYLFKLTLNQKAIVTKQILITD